MNITILGYGRFGKTLHTLLQDDHNIVIFDKNLNNTQDLITAMKSAVIFMCVPINQFEDAIIEILPLLTNQLIIDVLSVKTHPAKILKKYSVDKEIKAILTHPMFGPDSSKEGFEGLPLVIDQFTSTNEQYKYWKNYFESKGLKIVELKPEVHDKLAANSQGVAHFIGRTLKQFKFDPTAIDTLGAKKLSEVMEQTCNDSFELFHDLQTFNPYTKEMRNQLGNALDIVYAQLLPNQVENGFTTFGIQGGRGSFNEEALLKYLADKEYRFKIQFLYTTSNVLKYLQEGYIDMGLFAISNTLGGIVDETIEVLGSYKFEIIDQITINVRHFLMKRKDVESNDILSVMAHPQVFKQCAKTLQERYPNLKTVVGQGELIDTANAAHALSHGKVSKTNAILGPQGLADLYNFDCIDSNLQDNKDNRTSFLLVKRLC